MDDETSNTMNLDLNLGPGPDPRPESVSLVLDEPANVEDLIRIRDSFRLTRRHRWRWREIEPIESQDISLELNQLIVDSDITGNRLHTGEGSNAHVERTNEVIKAGENMTIDLDDDGLVQKGDEEKSNSEAVSFFDCNICMDLSKDPVVTCCGHLFCWPCIYRWLHLHSEAKECPVCKGQVTIKNVTPIYGRGNINKREPENDSNLKIPLRPQAQRVESLRQSLHRNAFAFPMEEMIRRLGNRYDLVRDFAAPQEPENGNNPSERSNAFLNRIMTSRGMRREQNGFVPNEDVVDLTRSTATSPEPAENRRIPSLVLRRPQIHRAATLTSISSAFSSAEGLVDAYFRNHPIPIRNNQDQAPPGDDRDSHSSIVAVINSESQTADNVVEIDSLVSISTSSSRRRHDTSVDSGDSRAPRRRRLN